MKCWFKDICLKSKWEGRIQCSQWSIYTWRKNCCCDKTSKNELGKFAKKIIDSNGVSDEFVVYDESKNKRLAIYYYEYGSSPRKPNVTYDRQNSSFQSFKADEVNSSVYNRTEIFHTSGITLGLCETSNKLTYDLIKNFKDGEH